MKGIVVSSDSNRATQYKALKDAVPVFCAEKGYIGVGGSFTKWRTGMRELFTPLLQMMPNEEHFLRRIRL